MKSSRWAKTHGTPHGDLRGGGAARPTCGATVGGGAGRGAARRAGPPGPPAGRTSAPGRSPLVRWGAARSRGTAGSVWSPETEGDTSGSEEGVFTFFSFCLLRATPAASVRSQARGLIELQLPAYTTAMATPGPSSNCDLHHSPCNAGSFTR